MEHRRRARLENRSGFTLIMMAFALTVLLGCAALAVDVSLMYDYRAQLARTADATALGGVVALGNGAAGGSVDTAMHYAALNAVGTNTNTLASADVIPGTWTPGGGFVATAGWTTATGSPFAVKTTTRYTGNYGVFARYFGFTTKNLTATAVAVRGSAKGSTCVRPWAFDYQSLLDKLFIPGSKTTAYDLSNDDVARLAALGAGSAGAVIFDGVRLPPGEFADGTAGGDIPGGSVYRDQIGYHTCAELDALLATASPPPPTPYIGIGDWLKPESGVKNGPTKQGINALCGDDNCSPAVPVVVALYETAGNAPGGHCGGCYKIKYMSEFMLTGYDGPTKSPKGYFARMSAVSGGFIAKPGPIVKNALVQ